MQMTVTGETVTAVVEASTVLRAGGYAFSAARICGALQRALVRQVYLFLSPELCPCIAE